MREVTQHKLIKSLTKPNCYYVEEFHEYKSLVDDKLWAGVSSVSGLAKGSGASNALLQWAANMCSAYVDEHWKTIESYREEDKKDILEKARYAYKEYSKEAMDIGTTIHKELENYVKFKIGYGQKHVMKSENEFIQKALERFVEETKDWTWVASEMLVGCDELEVAGRLDALALIGGKLQVIDFKVSSGIDQTYYIQTAGYALCLESMGAEIKGRKIVRIPKTEKRKIWDPKLKQSSMVINDLEIVDVPTNYEWDKEVFRYLRSVYKWINAKK